MTSNFKQKIQDKQFVANQSVDHESTIKMKEIVIADGVSMGNSKRDSALNVRQSNLNGMNGVTPPKSSMNMYQHGRSRHDYPLTSLNSEGNLDNLRSNQPSQHGRPIFSSQNQEPSSLL